MYSNKCISCNLTIPGCDSCYNRFNEFNVYNQSCSKCQTGYGVMPINNGGIASICKKCSKCTESCYFKDDTENSEEFCVTGTCTNLYFNWDDYKCDNCIDSKCNKCFPNQSKCLNCDKEYYIIYGDTCEKCPYGCKCNGNYGKCVGCLRDYYYDNNECYPCGSSCKECIIDNNRDSLCIVCADRYYLDKTTNKCKPCNPSCFKCIDYNKCIDCDAGLKLTQDMNCECKFANEYLNGVYCAKCNIECNGCAKSGGNCTIKLFTKIILLKIIL